MKKQKYFIHLAIILFLIIGLIKCSGTDESDFYNFKVISTGAGFSGYYILDDDDPVTFSDDSSDSVIYTYEKNLDTPTSIDYYVQGKEDADSITVKIYVNKVRVHNETDTVSTEEPLVALDDYYDFTSKSTSSSGSK